MKSGPDVFADALVLQEPPPMVRAAPNFPNPPDSSFGRIIEIRAKSCKVPELSFSDVKSN